MLVNSCARRKATEVVGARGRDKSASDHEMIEMSSGGICHFGAVMDVNDWLYAIEDGGDNEHVKIHHEDEEWCFVVF